jgi:hypothetical protein
MTEAKRKLKPIKRIILEYGSVTKEELFQIIEEFYGKNLLSLQVDKDGLLIELIEVQHYE